MTGTDISALAVAAIVIVVLAEHLAIWSLFYRRGWKVSVPPVPKPAANDSAGAAAGVTPAASADPATPLAPAA